MFRRIAHFFTVLIFIAVISGCGNSPTDVTPLETVFQPVEHPTSIISDNVETDIHLTDVIIDPIPRLILLTDPNPVVSFASSEPIRVQYLDENNLPVKDDIIAFEPLITNMAGTDINPRNVITDINGIAESIILAGIVIVCFDVKISVLGNDIVTPLIVHVTIEPKTSVYIPIAINDLEQAIETICSLDSNVFKNRNSRWVLINKIEVVLRQIAQGRYEEAIDKLENDILKKVDGCAQEDVPDRNDWIRNCDAQSQVYYLIEDAINNLKAEIGVA